MWFWKVVQCSAVMCGVVVACLSLFVCVCMCVYVLAASPQPPPRVTRNRLQSLPNTAGASILNSKFLPLTSRQRMYLC